MYLVMIQEILSVSRPNSTTILKIEIRVHKRSESNLKGAKDQFDERIEQ